MSFVIDIAFAIFLVFLFLQLLLSVASFRSGLRFSRYVRNRIGAHPPDFQGLVTVIVPCRGREDGLAENLAAITAQRHERFELLFVVESESDDALSVIESLDPKAPESKVVVAGKASDSGQKVHNLIEAVMSADDASEAFVFVDSDARPGPDWLRHLLAPLTDESVACSSGYRWFVPAEGGVAAHLRSAWNASVTSALGEDRESNFCWGGSTAIRRDTFENLDIISRWRGTLSDDFVLTRELRRSGMGVHFEPKCITATIGDCSLADLFEFTTRQMKITRTYSPRHFFVSLAGAGLFSLTFFPALLSLLFLDGIWFASVLAAVGAIWLLGTLKSIVRLKAVEKCPGIRKNELRGQLPAQVILWPFSSLLFLLNDIAALISNRITWRGITYELVSDKEVRIIS